MIRASKIKHSAGKLRSYPVAFERRGHFRVIKNKAIREPAIRKKRNCPVHRGFEAMSLFAVGDGDSMQV